MWWMIPVAVASDMSFTCEPLAATEDAVPYLSASRTAGATVQALAEAWMTCTPAPCATPSADTSTGCEEAACTTAEGAVVTYRYEAFYEMLSGSSEEWSEVTDITVAPATEPWSSLSVHTDSYSFADGSYTSVHAWVRTASWAGELDPAWPVDGGFTSSASSWGTIYDSESTESWDDGGCAWSHREYDSPDRAEREIGVDADTVLVVSENYGGVCGSLNPHGWLNGVYQGALDAHDWTVLYPDADGDGCSSDVDCDDADPAVNPEAEDVPHDGVDQDCDGADAVDGDGDGWGTPDDCDDTDPTVHPGAPEVYSDGIDQDCDGVDGIDADRDGAEAGVDCDDADPTRYPGAPETAYDGIDQDCDGVDLDDLDGDGFGIADDCDDGDATIYPGAPEVAYDGVDQDCDGADLLDADDDGSDSPDDCDDADATVYPGAPEVPYDGVDQDCDGLDLDDLDGDGFGHASDCDDGDASAYPGAPEIAGDGIDQDCDGVDASAVTGDSGEPPDSGDSGDDAPADTGDGSSGGGCSGGSAAAFFPVALLLRRRRRGR